MVFRKMGIKFLYEDIYKNYFCEFDDVSNFV